MAISLADNLKIQGKKQNVERDSFLTIADMKAYNQNYLPDIFIATCKEDGKIYVYNTSNEEDETLGKWRLGRVSSIDEEEIRSKFEEFTIGISTNSDNIDAMGEEVNANREAIVGTNESVETLDAKVDQNKLYADEIKEDVDVLLTGIYPGDVSGVDVDDNIISLRSLNDDIKSVREYATNIEESIDSVITASEEATITVGEMRENLTEMNTSLETMQESVDVIAEGVFPGDVAGTDEDGETISLRSLDNDMEPLRSIDKYTKYLNTELDYCFMSSEKLWTDVKINIPVNVQFETVEGNMSLDENKYIKLSKGKTYNIAITLYSNIGNSGRFGLYREDGTQIHVWYVAAYNNQNATKIYTPLEDEYAYVKFEALDNSKTTISISFKYSNISIAEINRIITVDPVDYISEDSSMEDSPIGHIMSFMGKTPPKHYLTCDGAIYNIADYQKLATFINGQFGSYNYFGGDGILTFAVPDLRGEFLRGTGTATRNTGTGEDVGVHQEGTEILWTQSGNLLHYPANLIPSNADAITVTVPADSHKTTPSPWDDTTVMSGKYTARPTNTAILYCIKYEPTYFMAVRSYRQETVLWEGSTDTVGTSYNLIDSIKNYDEIRIYACMGTLNYDEYTATVKDMLYTYNTGNQSAVSVFRIDGSTNMYSYRILFNNTGDAFKIELKWNASGWDGVTKAIKKIVGIKYATSPDFPDPPILETDLTKLIEDTMTMLESGGN